MDDAQTRATNTQLLQSRDARDLKIERANAAPGADDETCLSDIAAGAANPLPWNGLRQDLNMRTSPVDGTGIDHAVATIRHRVSGFDPDRQVRQ